MDTQGGGADAFHLDAQLTEEKAQVLHHVVSRGIADDRQAGSPGSCHDRILGDGITTLYQSDVVLGCSVTMHGGVILAVVRLHRQAKTLQR